MKLQNCSDKITVGNNGYPLAATESVIGKFLLLLDQTTKHGTEPLGGPGDFRIARNPVAAACCASKLPKLPPNAARGIARTVVTHFEKKVHLLYSPSILDCFWY